MIKTDVAVIGGGPAGLAAAIAARKTGADVVLIEREARLGGILKQCIHDGFGLVRFGEKLSGPEYAGRFIDEYTGCGAKTLTLAFVTRLEKQGGRFLISVVDRSGVNDIDAGAVVLATGCRERTAKQVSIHGTRPAGVFTAGTAQRLVNIDGQLPTKKCVILGSGDIGLIMARRLTLEGAEVEGVYEAKPEPSGLTRNIRQCLDDFGIPLHLSCTVTRVFGDRRLEAVELCGVDAAMKPVPGTERRVECDALILSVGLIPENELAESLGAALDARTKGPRCDAQLMTEVSGVFCCGNALHVNDLVDYVSESGELAGRGAACYTEKNREYIELEAGRGLLSLVPQRLDLLAGNGGAVLYFRSAATLGRCRFVARLNGAEVFAKEYPALRPPEMARLPFDFSALPLTEGSRLCFDVEAL